MATNVFNKLNEVKDLNLGNIQCFNVYQDSILNYVTGPNCPMGITFVYTQNATDSKAPGSVSITMVVKPTSDGTYARLYHFLGNEIYASSWQGTVPSSITWTRI